MDDSEKNEALVITDVSYWFGEVENRNQVLHNNCLTFQKGENLTLKMMTAKQYAVYILKLLQGQIEPEQRKGLAVMIL